MYKITNIKKLVATIAADSIGKLLFLPAGLFRKEKKIDSDQICEILIIRTAFIGDVVMTLPILKPLKDRFPDSRITFLTATSASDLLKNNPHIDEIMIYDPFWFYSKTGGYRSYLQTIRKLRNRRFDLVIEARGDIRDILLLAYPIKAAVKIGYDVGGGGYLLTHLVPYEKLKHKVEYHLDIVRFLGCHADRHGPLVFLDETAKTVVKRFLKTHDVTRPFVCVHPGARLFLKRWPAEKCARLYDLILKELRMPVVIVSDKGELSIVRDVMERMKTRPVVFAGSLRELAGILAESSLFVCNDSAPMHIAAAMKTPIVAIFGPSKSAETAPYGTNGSVVETYLSCRRRCDEHSCNNRRFHACMAAIKPDEVYHAVTSMLNR